MTLFGEDLLLPPNQVIAASMIALGETKKNAAKAAKVSPQTVSEWMHDSEFVDMINLLKTDMMREVQDRFRGLAHKAIDVIDTILETSENERIRLDGAKYILDTIRLSPTENNTGLWITHDSKYEHLVRRQMLEK